MICCRCHNWCFFLCIFDQFFFRCHWRWFCDKHDEHIWKSVGEPPDFYEDDESIEKIKEVINREPDGVTSDGPEEPAEPQTVSDGPTLPPTDYKGLEWTSEPYPHVCFPDQFSIYNHGYVVQWHCRICGRVIGNFSTS